VPLGFYPANQTIYNVLNLTKAAPGIPYVLFMPLCSLPSFLPSFPPLSLFVCRCIAYELARTLTSVLQLRHQLPRSEVEREEIDWAGVRVRAGYERAGAGCSCSGAHDRSERCVEEEVGEKRRGYKHLFLKRDILDKEVLFLVLELL
jgi:hypothetical protein